MILSGISFAQVGINTVNPQGIFNVDGGKDNPATGVPTAAQSLNDFVVKADGKIGIGTNSPGAKLEINNGSTIGAIKIVDGTQSAGKVLTSDANGVGSWTLPGALNFIYGNVPTVDNTVSTISDPGGIPGYASPVAYSGMYIDLPVGSYQLGFSLWYIPGGATQSNAAINGTTFSTIFFSTSSIVPTQPNYPAGSKIKSVLGGRLDRQSADCVTNGTIPVRNSTIGVQRIYLWAYVAPQAWVTPYNPATSQITFSYSAGGYGPYCQLYAIPIGN